MKEIVQELLTGAVDFHIHVAPDPEKERIADAFEIASQAKAVGIKGVVLKSHHYPTAPIAQIAERAVEGIKVFGGLALNDEIGGINPKAVEVSAKIGAKVVWMPTTSSLVDRRRKGFDGGLSVLGGDGKILVEVKEVLALIRDHDLVLGTGHISQEEISALYIEAEKMGIKKFVLTHPLRGLGPSVDLNVQKELAKRGAFVEYCFVATMPLYGGIKPNKIAETIKLIGAEKCLLSTDFGHLSNPPPWEGMRMMIATFLECNMSEHELRILVKENPCRLLNL